VRGGQTHEAIATTLRRAAATLREANVPFMVGGSVACWARGGPRSQNDVDLMVPRDHAVAALSALEEAGMRTEHPPEEWLAKAWDGEVMIDLIFKSQGIGEITTELVEQAEELQVLAIRMKVMSLEDVLVGKLLSISEQHLDFATPLEVARSLRERIDWPALRARTADSPYARAFFALLAELGILPKGAPAGASGDSNAGGAGGGIPPSEQVHEPLLRTQ
jgi:predicted nucleotidyltransferase